MRHSRGGHKRQDVAFPTGILVDAHGVVRWVYEAEFGHMRMTPTDLFEAVERLVLEEQNRELRRVRAVGKVVRQVFLMDKPDDLALTIDVMQEELRLLGLRFAVCGIAIIAPDETGVRAYTARGDGALATRDISIDERAEVRELIESWKAGEVRGHRLEVGSAEAEDKFNDLRWIVTAPFSHGVVFVGDTRREEPSEDHIATLTEFADAISVAFQRFVDFRELEDRNEQLQETQLQLIQSEKMASLGQLVAGVAHELNTPIGAILSNTQTEAGTLERILALLESGNALDDRDLAQLLRSMSVLRDMNGVSQTAGRRVQGIVSNLRKFARLDESDWQPTDLRKGIDETLALVQHKTEGRITIHKQYGDLPPVPCYAGQINQVFMNLIVNGIQAIDHQGWIRIETRVDGDEVQVRVIDNGSGIAESDIDKVFDPGFTTKGVGVGTGLGLSICFRIIENHSGRLTVESTPGEGSSFTVALPVKPEPPSRRQQPSSVFSTGTARVS